MSTIKPRARWMLVAALAVGLAGPTLVPQAANADEVVRTNMEASLRARPGERAPTLAHLDEGQSVRVLGRQGRWLKVSVKGKVGWITRTQVDDSEPMSARATADKKRKSDTKARKKGWSSMDDEAVGADAVEGEDEDAGDEESGAEMAAEDSRAKDEKAESKDESKDEAKQAEDSEKGMKAKKVAAKPRKKMEKIAKGGEVVTLRSTTVHTKPSMKSEEKWDADKGTKMTVVAISEGGDWIKVKDGEGDKGWVAKKDLQARAMDGDGGDDAGDAVESSDEESPLGSDDGSKSVRQTASTNKGTTVWAQANVGILNKTTTYRSNGEGLVANYALANTAPAVVGSVGLMRGMGKLSLGADAAVTATMGGAGITIAGDQNETLGWAALQIEARGTAAYRLSDKGYALGARAGYHVDSVTVTYSENAKLPSEKLSGFTLGAVFMAPRLTEKLGMHIAADYLLGAELLQTENVKDGDSSTATVFFASAGANYQLTQRLGITMTYQMAYEGFAFAGTNQRLASAANARRLDIQHVVGFGMGLTF